MDVKSAFVFCVFMWTCSGFLIKTPVFIPVPKTVRNETGWLHLQKLILPLFEDVYEISRDPIVVRLASEFDLATIGPCFTNPSVIDNLKNLQVKGFLPKDQVFTEYNIEHLNEFKIIYDVLCNAKDLDTFFKTAAWFRQNVNSGLFVDAIYTALLTRGDTQHLGIPAPYELLPNYFINQNILIKAVSLLNNNINGIEEDKDIVKEGNSYVLKAKYTADYYDNEDESVLAYFNEDIGLNTYHFLKRLKNSLWFNNPTDIDSKYGEFLYFTFKQLAARYDLERYSNGFDSVEVINWEKFESIPYDSLLVHITGDTLETFGERKEHEVINIDDEDTALLKDIENNIPIYVAHVMKFVQDKTVYSKTQILNHLMEILVTKSNSYEFIARKVLHRNIDQLTTLDHYMTSLRDPMFWRLNKKLVDLVDKALQILPKYSKKQLYFPGVQVINVDIKKLITMCDNFRFDVTDALKSSTMTTTFRTLIEQPRLNHKPFTVKITISSAIKQKGIVKVFLGPKILPGEFLAHKNSFILLDSFETLFKLGTNVVSRSSVDMTNLSNDFESLKTLRNKVLDTEFGLEIPSLSTVRSQVGFPSRLIIPKGSEEGLPFQIFVFVAPYVSSTNIDFNSNPVLSPGYPLDLGIEDTDLFELPNALLKDIIITHKSDSKSSADETEANKDGYNSPYRPERTFGQLGSFDYKTKKGKFDYKSKKTPQYGKVDDTYNPDNKPKPVSKSDVVKPAPVDLKVENIDENAGFKVKDDNVVKVSQVPLDTFKGYTNNIVDEIKYTNENDVDNETQLGNTLLYKKYTDNDIDGKERPASTYVYKERTTDNDVDGKVRLGSTYVYKERATDNDVDGKERPGSTYVYKERTTDNDEDGKERPGSTYVYKERTTDNDVDGKVRPESTYVYKERTTDNDVDLKERPGSTYVYKERTTDNDVYGKIRPGSTYVYKERTTDNDVGGLLRPVNTYVYKELPTDNVVDDKAKTKIGKDISINVDKHFFNDKKQYEDLFDFGKINMRFV